MTKIVSSPLPNALSASDVSDPVMKQKIALLQENIKSVYSQLVTLQKAASELQNGNSVSMSSLATSVYPYVADVVAEKTDEAKQSASSAATYSGRASASATSASESAKSASASATSASESEVKAKESETNASASETNASASETNAAKSESSASGSEAKALEYSSAAQEAMKRAEAAAATAEFRTAVTFFGVDMGANVKRKLFLEDFVVDTSKTYDVKISFNNTYNGTTTAVFWKNTESTTASDGTSVTLPAYGHASETVEMTGEDYVRIDNIRSTNDVVVVFSMKEE